jgi:hypothetical protein
MSATPLIQHNHATTVAVDTTAPQPAEAVSELVLDEEAERIANASRMRWLYTQRFGLGMLLVTGISMAALIVHLALRLLQVPA